VLLNNATALALYSLAPTQSGGHPTASAFGKGNPVERESPGQ